MWGLPLEMCCRISVVTFASRLRVKTTVPSHVRALPPCPEKKAPKALCLGIFLLSVLFTRDFSDNNQETRTPSKCFQEKQQFLTHFPSVSADAGISPGTQKIFHKSNHNSSRTNVVHSRNDIRRRRSGGVSCHDSGVWYCTLGGERLLPCQPVLRHDCSSIHYFLHEGVQKFSARIFRQ